MQPKSALASTVAAVLVLASCGSDDSSSVSREDAVETYARGVHASYSASFDSASALDSAIDSFIADPTDANMDAAKSAWLAARDDYGVTEAFRFYGGPIDNEEDGPEGLINAWPMDEGYIDYVDGNESAGIVNDPETYPTIDAALLTELNEAGGETNISTGWHAIEFLLWGQDLSEDGPGDRPASDYVDAANADRRGTYLAEVSDLLLVHLGGLVDAWDPEAGGNFYEEFTSKDTDAALTDIFTGIGELSRGELAGERMNVAYSERSQEDEHSCFADNTTNDIIANAVGIQMVLTGDYPGDVEGPSILDLIADTDSDLAEQLEAEVNASVDSTREIPAPFDQHLRDGVPDSDPGRMSILTSITFLEDQTPTIVTAADTLGLAINVT
ncbi:MAG: imelysin family protein [Actinomycetota bacterium]